MGATLPGEWCGGLGNRRGGTVTLLPGAGRLGALIGISVLVSSTPLLSLKINGIEDKPAGTRNENSLSFTFVFLLSISTTAPCKVFVTTLPVIWSPGLIIFGTFTSTTSPLIVLTEMVLTFGGPSMPAVPVVLEVEGGICPDTFTFNKNSKGNKPDTILLKKQ
jgi:hypothetical protein